MKTVKHIVGSFYCIYDLKTKDVLVSPRAFVADAVLNYDDKRVGILVAASESDLQALISNLK